MTKSHEQPTSNVSGLARNAALSAGSLFIPLALALITIPVVLRGYGPERFGIYAIGQVVFGYFGLLDLGIGKAATRFIGLHLAEGDPAMARRIAGFSVWLATLFGLSAGLLLFTISPVLVGHVLNVPVGLHEEGLLALRAVALTVPLGMLGSTLQGTLEGARRFLPSSIIQALAGVASQLAPVIVLIWTTNIGVVLLVLAGIKAVQCGALYFAKRSIYRAPIGEGTSGPIPVREIVAFSSWLTITNVISPLMVSLDRFVIGSILTMSAVAYYSAPYTAMSRLLILPSSTVRALLPEVSRRSSEARTDLWRLASAVSKVIGVTVTLLAVPAVGLADVLLKVWLGASFGRESALAMQLISMGVIVNAIAYIPFTVLQGIGRTDIAAKAHVLELVLYVPLLFALTRGFGIAGAAGAWALRALLDLILLVWALGLIAGARFWTAGVRNGLARLLGGIVCTVGLAVLTCRVVGIFPAKVGILAALETGWLLFGYYGVLSVAERRWLKSEARLALVAFRRPVRGEAALEGRVA